MRAARIVLALLLVAPTASATPDDPRPGSISSESRFARDGVEYRIRAEKFPATVQYGTAIRIAYRVWRDGTFLHPEAPDGGRRVAPVHGSEQTSSIDLTLFPDAAQPVGWLIRCGYGSGNPSSDLAMVVLPKKDGYREVAWEWKSFCGWTVVHGGVRTEVWTCWQDAGTGVGTAGQIFVPERRVLTASRDGASLRLAPLDPDWTRWPDAYSRPGFAGAYVAGLRQRNPALMRAALSLWSPDSSTWAKNFGLPGDVNALRDLIDAVQGIVDAQARVHRLSPLIEFTKLPDDAR
jgi:hypothetical protein